MRLKVPRLLALMASGSGLGVVAAALASRRADELTQASVALRQASGLATWRLATTITGVAMRMGHRLKNARPILAGP